MRPLLLIALAISITGCDEGPPAAPQYYDRVIQPILTASCVRQQGGCHIDDGTGNALGNLNLTSYDKVIKRRDALRIHGSYPIPLMLLKAVGKASPVIPYEGRGDGTTVFLENQIDHAGGPNISIDSSAYLELQQWMANGAQRDGSLLQRPQQMGTGDCRRDFGTVRPDVTAQLATVDTQSQAFRDFAQQVEPILTQSCAFATCHSNEQSDFFITCRGSEDASKFNFLEAQAFLGTPIVTSKLLLKPLAPQAGGLSHTGGVFFPDKSDEAWRKLSDWAALAGVSPVLKNLTPGQKFFNESVMPVMLARGCALEGCHSPGSSNDFKLRAGSGQGFFSAFSLASNYRFARHDFLVAEVPDVRQSRLVKKPIVGRADGGFGLTHRGGPPLQTPGEVIDPAMCPVPWTDMSTPFCTLVEWHRIERADLLTKGEADTMGAGSTLPLVSVVRPADADRPIDFDSYRPGADLVISQVSLAALGAILPGSASAPQSLLDNCAGVLGNRSNVDVRAPDPAYDGTKVAFAMRLSAADTLDIYEVTLDLARTCTKVTAGNGMSTGGILHHNFDPMYAPDGSLVFASSRGRPTVGPTRSPKFLLPQSDLWRMMRSGGAYGAPQQMTSLGGAELMPSMMLNGQVAFTTEKATPDFYQLSGRRINWDLTDYHPLLAQRAQSLSKDYMTMAPSVGYSQATDIREGVDRNFVLVLSDVGAKGGGGALATFNRSIGPFQANRGDITFLHAVQVIDPAATGRAGATQGAYRSPFPLPDGRILVSYAPDVTDLAGAASLRYDLVVIDPLTGMRTPVANYAGGVSSRVEAVLVYKREPRALFKNFTQLVFGGHLDPAGDTSHGTVHFPDLPMLGTLLGANLRSGRFVDHLRTATQVAFFENRPAPADAAAAMTGQTGTQNVYSMRTLLGKAPLAQDGSVQLRLPSLTPVILELQTDSGSPVFTMTEEDQFGPAEYISRGVPQQFFDSVCGGCHGSVSGIELDVSINADALTGASVSLSRDPSRRVSIGP